MNLFSPFVCVREMNEFLTTKGIWGYILYTPAEHFVMWYYLLTCKPFNFSRTEESVESSHTDSQPSRQGSRRQMSGRNLSTSSLLLLLVG